MRLAEFLYLFFILFFWVWVWFSVYDVIVLSSDTYYPLNSIALHDPLHSYNRPKIS